jgi:hypothetical protein
MKSSHGPRARAGKHDATNEAMRKLDGMGTDFWQYVWMHFGLKQAEYPVESTQESWQELYHDHPEVDPDQQYHGDW